MEDNARDMVLMGLVIRARTDQEFKRSVRTAIDRVLIDEYRYDLNEAELEMCRNFFADTVHLTEEEFDDRLRELAERPEEGV